MKTRIVLAGLMATMMVLEVSAQRAEYDDMYFTAKDREKNKAIQAEESNTPVKVKKQKIEEVEVNEDYSNPLDSYSARNVNPEYVSRANSEEASEDEENYYVEGYTPANSNGNFNYNNSYYNNANWARNSYYANNGWYNPYYGGMGMMGFGYDPWMMNSMYSPYGYGGGFGYDPFMSPYYGYGMRSGWSMSIGYGWGNNFGWGGYPYYGGGYSNIWYGNNYYGGGYYNEPSRTNYGRRPSRNSAVVTPSQRTVSRTRTSETTGGRNASVNNTTTTRTRTRQTQDEYYVRPARRTATPTGNDAYSRPANNGNNTFSRPATSQPTRTRDNYSPTTTPSRSSSPSYTPSSTPSRSSGGSSGGGGGSSPRPRGRN